jgi:succinoglycan biosynthesis protein ExoL
LDNPPAQSNRPILYFVPDLSDPATARRLEMFRLGGADFSIVGFDRRPETSKNFSFTSLGVTRDAALLQRTLSILKAILRLPLVSRSFPRADVIIARNLEMLLFANLIVLSSRYRKAEIIYECLDLHRILLGGSFLGKVLRRLEKRLLKNVKKIIISSEAYFDSYFSAMQKFKGDFLLVENKPLLENTRKVRHEGKKRKTLKIGYFGMLRCRKSLEILKIIADNPWNQIGIVIAGVPSPAIFSEFDRELSLFDRIGYLGPYASIDLGALYQKVEFSWCIDFYEEGLNSRLLLPNRLYESLAFGVIPIAIAGTETARWLTKRHIGKVFSDTEEIIRFFEKLELNEVANLKRDIALMSTNNFAFTAMDCRNLIQKIYSPK